MGRVSCNTDPGLCARFRFAQSPTVVLLVGSLYYRYMGRQTEASVENYLWRYEDTTFPKTCLPRLCPVWAVTLMSRLQAGATGQPCGG